MSRLWLSVLSACALLVISNAAFAQDNYVFGIEGGPDEIMGNPGEMSTHQLQNMLSHTGPGPGAQGWSFSIVADNASITDINTGICNFPPNSQQQMDCENDPNRPDTKARELFFGGFEQSELTTAGTGDCEGLNGATSGVTLSFAFPVTLPPNESAFICQTTIDIVLPDANANAVVRYVDNCQGGGQPIETIAVQDGLALNPSAIEDKVIALNVGGGVADCADYAFYLGNDPESDLDATGGAQSFDVTMRNIADATAFEIAVENNGGALAFVDGVLGIDSNNLRNLVIVTTDSLDHAPDETNTGTIDADVDIVAVNRKGVTDGSDDSSFFGASILDGTAPETGVGFVLGYADLTPDQSIIIPATPEVDPCPVNVIAEVEVAPIIVGACEDYAFYLGNDAGANLDATGGAQTFDVTMRNSTASSGFELAVENNGGALAFVDGVLGVDPNNLRNLVIIKDDGTFTAVTASNTGTIDSDLGIVDVRRKGTTAGSDDTTFFGASILDGSGDETGVGFVLGYLDLTPDQSITIPATGDGSPCPLNVIAEVEIDVVGAGNEPFNRGEVNGDGKHNIADAAVIVRRVFNLPIGFTPADCDDMFDVNNDDQLGVDDTIYLLNWMFKRGPLPESPFQVCEPKVDPVLGCNESNCVAP